MKKTRGELLQWTKTGTKPASWAARGLDGEYVVSRGEVTLFGFGKNRRVLSLSENGDNSIARQWAEDHYARRHPLRALAAQGGLLTDPELLALAARAVRIKGRE